MMKKYWEILLFFLVISILSLGNIANICKIYSPLNFDNQALLVWEYTASIGMFPYRDIFYPYGLLTYLKNQHIFFSVLYFFVTPLIFTVIFLYFKNLFTSKFFHYISFSFFFVFVLLITGFEIFSRYGIVVALAILFSFLFFYRPKFFYRWLFLIGIGIGVIFSLVNDQGVYGVLLFFVYALVEKSPGLRATPFIKGAKSVGISLAKEASIFIGGFFVGVTPFFLYLVRYDALGPFLSYMKTIPELSLYAKTPFFHALINPNNVFILAVLFFGLFLLSYKIFIAKEKLQLNTYVQIGLVFILILLEQKNIIRLMDMQMTFIAFLLFISLFYEFQNFLTKKKFEKWKQGLFYVGTLSIILLSLKQSSTIPIQLPSLTDISRIFQTVNENSCVKNNLQYIPDIYTEVKNEITKDPKFNGKIFSFPSDPLFYILFKQRPPYYPNAYDGSALHAQQDTISYIEKNNVQYVILNTEIKSIQDEVPDYVRTPHIFSYIVNNFKPYATMNEYLILRKDKKKDFFRSEMEKEYKDFLLTVDFENIPRSEGYHKGEFFKENKEKGVKVILEGKSVAEVNAYLKKNTVESKGKFLVLEFMGNAKKETASVVIRSKDGLKTQVSMRQCESGVPCIIHLSRLPLFYKNMIVQEITGDYRENISSVKIVEVKDDSLFW